MVGRAAECWKSREITGLLKTWLLPLSLQVGPHLLSLFVPPYGAMDQNKPSTDKKPTRNWSAPFVAQSTAQAGVPCTPSLTASPLAQSFWEQSSGLLGHLRPVEPSSVLTMHLLSKLRWWWIFKFLNLCCNNPSAILHIMMQEGNRCVFLWF